ncbi:hypothetical protein [Marinococcus halotolerans]|uniref:hypothetical protein n=1 Tax=Marinococcus halotolerans TaxID=301092 RepID=UPI0003B33F0D|nr:hypothetical protein [Marinococcus halotolerans]
MDFIPFENTWPYDKIGEDIYINECPYCGSRNILTAMKVKDLEWAKEEIKTYINMPCCHKRMHIVFADEDYLWTTEPLRRRERKS